MATLKQKIAAECKVRELLEREAMPLPDRIEYGFNCIRLLWDQPQVALIVDIDDISDASEQGSAEIDAVPREG